MKTEEGWTALMFATQEGRFEIVELLINCGAEVNAKNEDGETALTVAEKKDYSEIVQLMKETRENR